MLSPNSEKCQHSAQGKAHVWLHTDESGNLWSIEVNINPLRTSRSLKNGTRDVPRDQVPALALLDTSPQT